MIGFMIRTLAALLFLTLSACAKAPEWNLVDANNLRGDTYLILTVPDDDPAALALIAKDISRDYDVPLAAEWPLKAIGVHCFVFDASKVPDIQALIDAMEKDSRIRTAQRIQDFTTTEAFYTDPLYPLQNALNEINVAKAHQISLGEGIRIGVVDSAIDVTHKDLKDRMDSAHDFVAAGPSRPAEEHGTAVAGVIAASAGNAVGIVGVAPEARLLGLRACWQAAGQIGRCNSFSLARAINFAILNDVDVLNLSIGGTEDPLLRELIEAALAKEMIVIAASGEGRNRNAFPASMSGVIAAGLGRSDRIPAPMRDVITTAPGERHRFASGSSIATAHVTGIVALLLAENSSLSRTDVGQALSDAVDIKNETRVLDACSALTAIGADTTACSP
ncbi:MAG: S8 family serine peptidase [Pseudomonadota bacterium]